MADNNDAFRMLVYEEKLDGTNYPLLWAYMMRHVLVARGLWNIVHGADVCPIVVATPTNAGDTCDVEDGTGTSAITALVRLPQPNVEQV